MGSKSLGSFDFESFDRERLLHLEILEHMRDGEYKIFFGARATTDTNAYANATVMRMHTANNSPPDPDLLAPAGTVIT